MPLLITTLVDEILKITDKSHAAFVGWPLVLTPAGALDKPGTDQLVATNWANAAGAFFAQISVPLVLPPVISAGTAAFQTAMAVLLAPGPTAVPPVAAGALAAGFAAFAGVIAANAAVPVALPPPGPLVIPIGPPIADPVIPALNIANAVMTWTKTGLWGPPPAPPSSPWA